MQTPQAHAPRFVTSAVEHPLADAAAPVRSLTKIGPVFGVIQGDVFETEGTDRRTVDLDPPDKVVGPSPKRLEPGALGRV